MGEEKIYGEGGECESDLGKQQRRRKTYRPELRQ